MSFLWTALKAVVARMLRWVDRWFGRKMWPPARVLKLVWLSAPSSVLIDRGDVPKIRITLRVTNDLPFDVEIPRIEAALSIGRGGGVTHVMQITEAPIGPFPAEGARDLKIERELTHEQVDRALAAVSGETDGPFSASLSVTRTVRTALGDDLDPSPVLALGGRVEGRFS